MTEPSIPDRQKSPMPEPDGEGYCSHCDLSFNFNSKHHLNYSDNEQPECPSCGEECHDERFFSFLGEIHREPILLDLYEGCICKDCDMEICSCECPMFLCEDCDHFREMWDDSVGYRDIGCAKGVF